MTMASGAAAARLSCPPRGGGSVSGESEAGRAPSGMRMRMGMGMNLGAPGAEKHPPEEEGEERGRRLSEPEQDSKADVTSQLSSLHVSEGSEKCQTEPEKRPQKSRPVTEEAEGNPLERSGIPVEQSAEPGDEQPQQDVKGSKLGEVPATSVGAYRVRKVSSDSVIIQSDHGGPEKLPPDPSEGPGRVVPVIDAASTWISVEMNEFKEKIRREKAGVMKVNRGNIVTVRVPTHPKGTCVCWDFATDTYDIGFGVYFEWAPVTDTEITVLVSESSDEEDEEDAEAPPVHGDIERGTKDFSRSDLEEILPVYRKDSHLEVQSGSHKYPGQGVYLLKFDNSYSIWRHKTLYYQVNYSS
ncbi:protein TMED8 [Carcharodon carcharias]|uniref:protein TMED8 n=1 Tax=Carcharodon carcharias TaxID=13397 RepID=UPI001B7DB8B4|nr:protein TMED8 [Carcharodon carcharias]